MRKSYGKSLLESAKPFLEEALSNLQHRHLNFAVLHAVTATELILKERLHRENPIFIYKSIDKPLAELGDTISLKMLPRRLRNLGMPLGQDEVSLVHDLSAWRDDIVHHMPSFDRDAAYLKVQRLLDFLARFLRRELDTPLEEFLRKDLYPAARRLLDDFQDADKAARERAQYAGKLLRGISCPRCSGLDVVAQQNDGHAYCQLCNTQLFGPAECEGCGEVVASEYRVLPEEFYCSACIEAAGDQYMDILQDRLRGK